MTLQTTYAPIPKDKKVLVVGVLSGNLGDSLEHHPRVIWWTGDEAARKDAVPAGVARVFVTKFLSHATFDKVRWWERRANFPYGKDDQVSLKAGDPGLSFVFQHGSTGQLKTAVYQSLGEHHPKWNPAPGTAAPAPPLTAMAAAMIDAARPSRCGQTAHGRPDLVCDLQAGHASQHRAYNAGRDGVEFWGLPDPPLPPPYASLKAFLADRYAWDSTLTPTAQGRELYHEAMQLGLTEASQESFATMVANWVGKHRHKFVGQQAAKALTTLDVQAKLAGATDPGPITMFAATPAPPAEQVKAITHIDNRPMKDSTAADADALLQMVQEAKRKAHEVIAALEMVETALPGLVEGLAAKEKKIEAAVAALRSL